VRHLDHRPARDRVAVERQQPVATVQVEHLFKRWRLEIGRLTINFQSPISDLRKPDAPPGILDAFAESHQA